MHVVQTCTSMECTQNNVIPIVNSFQMSRSIPASFSYRKSHNQTNAISGTTHVDQQPFGTMGTFPVQAFTNRKSFYLADESLKTCAIFGDHPNSQSPTGQILGHHSPRKTSRFRSQKWWIPRAPGLLHH